MVVSASSYAPIDTLHIVSRKRHERKMVRRRRAPRIAGNSWFGTYYIEDDPQSGFGDCAVIDFSILGVGLELFGPLREDLVGRRIVVQVHAPVGKSVSLRLVGEIKSNVLGPQGENRVGMEFVDLSESERAIIALIEEMNVVW
jgi:hypothetical protein